LKGSENPKTERTLDEYLTDSTVFQKALDCIPNRFKGKGLTKNQIEFLIVHLDGEESIYENKDCLQTVDTYALELNLDKYACKIWELAKDESERTLEQTAAVI